MAEKVRHILGLSGGKDSTALAIYMRDKVPEISSVILALNCPRHTSTYRSLKYIWARRLYAFLLIEALTTG
jgi:tRNA(Ile)-lysidine synthase TilS/MesJ